MQAEQTNIAYLHEVRAGRIRGVRLHQLAGKCPSPPQLLRETPRNTVLHGEMGFLWCCRGSRSCVSSTSQTPASSSFGSLSPACQSDWSTNPYVARHQRRHYALTTAYAFTFHTTPVWQIGSAIPARSLRQVASADSPVRVKCVYLRVGGVTSQGGKFVHFCIPPSQRGLAFGNVSPVRSSGTGSLSDRPPSWQSCKLYTKYLKKPSLAELV